MRIDPTRAKTLVSQLQAVSGRIAAAAKGRDVRPCCFPVFSDAPS